MKSEQIKHFRRWKYAYTYRLNTKIRLLMLRFKWFWTKFSLGAPVKLYNISVTTFRFFNKSVKEERLVRSKYRKYSSLSSLLFCYHSSFPQNTLPVLCERDEKIKKDYKRIKEQKLTYMFTGSSQKVKNKDLKKHQKMTYLLTETWRKRLQMIRKRLKLIYMYTGSSHKEIQKHQVRSFTFQSLRWTSFSTRSVSKKCEGLVGRGRGERKRTQLPFLSFFFFFFFSWEATKSNFIAKI